MRLTSKYKYPPTVLKDKETGKRVFVLANGPSVSNENLSLLNGEIIIGMNASTMLENQYDFQSDYYVLSDARFLQSEQKRPWATTKLAANTHRVIRSDIRAHDDDSCENPTTWVRPLERDGFSRNLSAGFYYGATTTMLAIQLAWHLGSREVYILGCDLRYPEDNPRFYEEDTPQVEDAFASVQIMNIVNAAKIFEAEGGRLINCSENSFLRPYLDYTEFSGIFALQDTAKESSLSFESPG